MSNFFACKQFRIKDKMQRTPENSDVLRSHRIYGLQTRMVDITVSR